MKKGTGLKNTFKTWNTRKDIYVLNGHCTCLKYHYLDTHYKIKHRNSYWYNTCTWKANPPFAVLQNDWTACRRHSSCKYWNWVVNLGCCTLTSITNSNRAKRPNMIPTKIMASPAPKWLTPSPSFLCPAIVRPLKMPLQVTRC